MKSRATRSDSIDTPALGEAAGEEGSEVGAVEVGAAEGERPELIDGTSYNLTRLEKAVSDLAHDHADLKARAEKLEVAVAERDSTIQKLESEIDRLGNRSKTAIQRLDVLVSELDRLDAELGGEPSE